MVNDTCHTCEKEVDPYEPVSIFCDLCCESCGLLLYTKKYVTIMNKSVVKFTPTKKDNKMKTILNYLSGKKTVFAATAWPIASWAALKGYIDQDTAQLVYIILTTWTGAALGHKVVKVKKKVKDTNS